MIGWVGGWVGGPIYLEVPEDGDLFQQATDVHQAQPGFLEDFQSVLLAVAL